MSVVPPTSSEPVAEPVPARRSWRQRLVLGIGIALVVVLLGAGGVAAYGWYRYSQIEQEDLALAESVGGEPINFLIVGSDSRDVVEPTDTDSSAFLNEAGADQTGQRGDTIMVARVDPVAKTVDLLSFPRDLWIPILPSGEKQRINTAYTGSGPQALIDTLKADFGIDINHYVEINFKSFKGIVEAVGGVPMYFDGPMRDEHTGFYQYELGCQTLNGEQGLAFSRARHLEYKDSKGRWQTDPSGDLGRINRQQEFMRAMVDRSQARFGDLNVKAINDIISSTADNLKVDSTLDFGEMVDLARLFRGFSGDQIVTHALPVVPFTTNGGAAVLRLDDALAEETLNVFRGLPPGTVSTKSVTVAVSNGSGAEMQATKVSGELAELGYVSSIGADAPRTQTRTVVRHAPGLERQADLVARQLGAGAELEVDRSLADAKVPIVLVTGTDFTGVLPEARPPAETTTSTTGPTTSAPVSSNPDEVTGIVGVTPGETPVGTTCQ
jgi:LCP family protein required for cell wall assembly